MHDVELVRADAALGMGPYTGIMHERISGGSHVRGGRSIAFCCTSCQDTL